MEPLNVRVPQPLLDEIDDKSDKRGFGSRSEFVRELLRDGIESEPRLDPDQIGTGVDEDGETFTLGEVRDRIEMDRMSSEARETFDTDRDVRRLIAGGESLGAVSTLVESDLGTLLDEDDDVDVLIAGCGGGGVSIASEVYQHGDDTSRTAIIDTDIDHLNSNTADTRAVLAKDEFDGQGADGDVETVREAVDSSRPVIRQMIGDADLVFVVAGLGGGTGTAVAPELAEVAQESDAVTVSLATLPFRADDSKVHRAREGLERLDTVSDTLAVLDADRVSADPAVSMSEALSRMNNNIAHLISQICLDIGQFYTTEGAESLLEKLSDGNRSVLLDSTIDTALGESYEELSDRLLQYTNVDIQSRRADRALLTFTAGPEVDSASGRIDSIISSIGNNAGELVWSSRVVRDPDSMENTEIRVTGFLTGFDIELDDFFDRESASAEEIISSQTESEIDILPGTGVSSSDSGRVVSD
jgi:cell division protein FtsZ